MNLSLENPLTPTLPVACALMGTLGAIIGSFLNVVIHRLPREQSIVFPNSSCPTCHAQIKAYDNIPILSFLILRGQCRACGAPISPRYPAVEALTALVFVAITWHDGWSLALGFDLAFGAAMRALVGSGSLWLMGFLWEKLRGVEAMGLGDVKMMFMVGAYLGWRLTILTIFLGVLSGSLIGIGLMLRRGKQNMQ